MNQVFILTSNEKRLSTLLNFYNVYGKPTDQILNVVIDDRVWPNYLESSACHHSSLNGNIIRVSEIIAWSKFEFAFKFKDKLPKYIDDILDMFPLSIKILLVCYCRYYLGQNKFLYLDDDILFLSPVDHLFDQHHVFYGGRNFPSLDFHNDCWKVLYEIFETKDFPNIEKYILNSGTLFFCER